MIEEEKQDLTTNETFQQLWERIHQTVKIKTYIGQNESVHVKMSNTLKRQPKASHEDESNNSESDSQSSDHSQEFSDHQPDNIDCIPK